MINAQKKKDALENAMTEYMEHGVILRVVKDVLLKNVKEEVLVNARNNILAIIVKYIVLIIVLLVQMHQHAQNVNQDSIILKLVKAPVTDALLIQRIAIFQLEIALLVKNTDGGKDAKTDVLLIVLSVIRMKVALNVFYTIMEAHVMKYVVIMEVVSLER